MKQSPKVNKYKYDVYLFWFVISILAFWIIRLTFLGVWVRGDNNAADILRFLEIVMFFLTLTSAIILLARILKDRSFIKLIPIVLLLSAQVVMLFIVSAGWGKATIVVTNILSKRISGEEYHFVINNGPSRNNTEFVCDEAIYDDLIIDENVFYTISYRSWTLNSKHGFLESIDTHNIIDNRR